MKLRHRSALERIRGRFGAPFVALAVVTAIAVMGIVSTAAAKPVQTKWVLGVSNTLVGNGWREEMICAVKAQALASGKVSKVIVANRNGGPAEQIADIRNLISAGANAIIINPSSANALNAVVAQAAARGVRTRSTRARWPSTSGHSGRTSSRSSTSARCASAR